MLAADHYVNFKDFRRYVLEIATKEINLYSDIEVSWEPVYKGRKVVQVYFDIKQRDTWGRYIASNRANDQLEGQISIFDYDYYK
jgi:plasmid replication initiation protein